MMELAVALVQWLHMVAGMLWVGGAVFFDLIVVPSTTVLMPAQQRALGGYLGARAGRFFAIVGAATLLLGIVRGTVVGPIHSLGALSSPYARTWLVALAVTIGLSIWGALVLGPAAERLYADDDLWAPAPAGDPAPDLAARIRRLALLGRVQLAGFAVVITCMVLMGEVFS
jgi:uncharacterized membrane protein